jgi:ferredoxin
MTAMTELGAQTRIARVWIESGCTSCGWCSDLLPDLFSGSSKEGSRIRGTERVDGRTDANERALSLLKQIREGEAAEFLSFVASGCPPQVIHIE